MADNLGVVKCSLCGGSLAIIVGEEGLGCIPFKGIEKNLLAGITKTRSGEVRYVGPNAELYTRAEALAKFGEAEVGHQDNKMAAAQQTAIQIGRMGR